MPIWLFIRFNVYERYIHFVMYDNIKHIHSQNISYLYVQKKTIPDLNGILFLKFLRFILCYYCSVNKRLILFKNMKILCTIYPMHVMYNILMHKTQQLSKTLDSHNNGGDLCVVVIRYWRSKCCPWRYVVFVRSQSLISLQPCYNLKRIDEEKMNNKINGCSINNILTLSSTSDARRLKIWYYNGWRLRAYTFFTPTWPLVPFWLLANVWRNRHVQLRRKKYVIVFHSQQVVLF